MEDQKDFFSILDSVDSSNNYAMGQVQAGLAKPGQAWFAKEQWAGRGQRGKIWKSARGENIILSIAVKPGKAFSAKPFLFNAMIAGVCHKFFFELAGSETKVKWPNDIYWRDRKTGGMLIENIYKGKEWLWAIIGIGININQEEFDEDTGRACSLKNITSQTYDPVMLAQLLHRAVIEKRAHTEESKFPELLQYYNDHLYKKNEPVMLKKENAVFQTTIRSVSEYGQLLTEDVTERAFDFGEVVWMPVT